MKSKQKILYVIDKTDKTLTPYEVTKIYSNYIKVINILTSQSDCFLFWPRERYIIESDMYYDDIYESWFTFNEDFAVYRLYLLVNGFKF